MVLHQYLAIAVLVPFGGARTGAPGSVDVLPNKYNMCAKWLDLRSFRVTSAGCRSDRRFLVRHLHCYDGKIGRGVLCL